MAAAGRAPRVPHRFKEKKLIRLSGLSMISLAVALLLCGTASPVRAGEKTDTLVMQNGNEITGEVKGLDQGQLTFNTDDLGTLSVNWDRVASIISNKTVLVEMGDGTRYVGVMEKPADDRRVALRTDDGLKDLAMERIFRISPIKKTFWGGLKGSFSLGASFTRSSDVLQFSASGDVSKRTRKTIDSLNLNLITTKQTDQSTENISLGYAHVRLLRHRWVVPALAAYERNQSLGIQNRFIVAAGGGRWLIESNRQTLAAFAGLDLNLEDTTGSDGGQTSLEAFAAVRYSRFRYHHPKQNLSVSFFMFPSLTESGRFRAQLNSHWRQEIVTDFFLEFSVYGSYDNQPPEGALLSTDYGLVTSVGYSFSP
jgi:hypothetical protein